MQYKFIIALILASSASAQVLKGFNYGATQENGACQDQAGFTNLFNKANSLQGTSGFTSARLYTTVQCGTANGPTSAIQAAIDTGTSLLLGMWASAGDAAFNNEILALKSAILTYPTLANQVIGISVGSEDLYRSSPQGIANQAGVGADAATIINYISLVRSAIAGTSLAGKPIGHVDTFTAWILPENLGVAQAVDFLGHNSFPYFETTHPNAIAEGAENFNSALANTESVAGGKPVWVTETGWPHDGPTSGQAVASTANAETYWDAVGCSLFGNRNTWWYTLEDANTAQTDITFGVTAPGSNTPLYDLSCANVGQSSASSSSTPTPSSTSPTPSSPSPSSSPSSSSTAVTTPTTSASQSSAQSPQSSSVPTSSTSSAQLPASITAPGQSFPSSSMSMTTQASSAVGVNISTSANAAASTSAATTAAGNPTGSGLSSTAVGIAPSSTSTNPVSSGSGAVQPTNANSAPRISTIQHSLGFLALVVSFLILF